MPATGGNNRSLLNASSIPSTNNLFANLAPRTATNTVTPSIGSAAALPAVSQQRNQPTPAASKTPLVVPQASASSIPIVTPPEPIVQATKKRGMSTSAK